MSRRAPVVCAAPRCVVPVEPGHLMCKGHWFAVPKPLRDEVWRTWRRLQNWRGRSSASALRPMIAAYREAVRAAVEYLDGVPPTPAAAMTTTAIDAAGRPVTFHQGRLL